MVGGGGGRESERDILQANYMYLLHVTECNERGTLQRLPGGLWCANGLTVARLVCMHD